MERLAADWYAWLSGLNAAVSLPLRDLADGLGLPIVSALIFGVIGATSPCQLTTNAAALAYLARGAGANSTNRVDLARAALAYLLGKAVVYTVVGAAIIVAGQQLAQCSIPGLVALRKALGPLMVLLGLSLAGLVPLRMAIGQELARWLAPRTGAGSRGAFLLGAAFGLAFCPTLFLLFFGLTLPLALSSPLGIVYPGVFALGTTLPLLGLAAIVALGSTTLQRSIAWGGRINAWMRPVAAVVLILIGLNDTLIYWLL